MAGRTSQRKGRRAEIELSSLLNERGYHTRPGEAVSFGHEPDVCGLPGLHVEVKRREQVDMAAALRQAQEDSTYFGDGLPAVFSRGNKEAWRVTMRLDDFIVLYRQIHPPEADGDNYD